MINLAQREADRNKLLYLMYHMANGDANEVFEWRPIQDHLGWDDDRFGVAGNWLTDHGMIVQNDQSGRLRMTSDGIDAAEDIIRANDKPDAPDYEPPPGTYL